MSHTLAQERSIFALKQLESLNGGTDKFAKLLAGLPAMILQNGFGQTLAFLLAKGTDDKRNAKTNDEHIQAFDVLVAWLTRCNILPEGNRGKAVKALASLDQAAYLQAQTESLALLEWVKRYAGAGLFKQGKDAS